MSRIRCKGTQDTIRKLSEMTDEGQLERLVTAILREAKPEYASLLHPGVTLAGIADTQQL